MVKRQMMRMHPRREDLFPVLTPPEIHAHNSKR
jgi:hypothetical protein